MSDPVKVEGLKELQAEVRRLKDKEVAKAVRKGNKTAAEVVLRKALPNVPVKSGRLKASVKAAGQAKSATVKAGASKAPYAAAVHWGRRWGNVGRPPGNYKGDNRVQANRFLWDALEASRDEVRDVYDHEIDKVMNLMRSRHG